MRTVRGLILALLLCCAAPAVAAPSWQALPGAPVVTRFDDLHFIDRLHGWICDGWGQIYGTADAGATWQLQYENGGVYFRCIRFADSQRGWAGTLSSDELLFQTTDGGATWDLVPGIPEPRPNAICGMWIASPQVIYGVGSYSGPARLIKSTDGGATWTSKDLAPLASTLVDVYFKSELEGYVVGSVGEFPDSCRTVVLRTLDGGVNWERRYLGSRYGEWGWKISFPTPSVGYVSLEREQGPMYVLKTETGGGVWAVSPFANYNEQGIGFITPTVGWVGGWGNPTFGTVNGGASWTQTPWGQNVNRFQFLSPTLGYAVGRTVYRYAEGTVDAPDATRLPNTLAAPNPFAARTTIRFALPARERVQLLIADPAGRIVRKLEDGIRDAGAHVVEWDGKGDRGEPMAPGIYLYVLHAGEQHAMGKLVRVR